MPRKKFVVEPVSDPPPALDLEWDSLRGCFVVVGEDGEEVGEIPQRPARVVSRRRDRLKINRRE